MYQPRLFRETDRARIHDLIDARSFGTLIVAHPSGLEISHVPFVLDREVGEHGQLRLHVARANPIWTRALAVGRVTAVFGGPHGYVSPSWYENPTEQVPTWNYAVAHAHGTPRELSRSELVGALDALVAKHEGSGASAWRMSRLSRDFVDELLREIAGLAISIDELEGKFMLSQNRSAVDHARVVEALRGRATPDDLEMAALMSEK